MRDSAGSVGRRNHLSPSGPPVLFPSTAQEERSFIKRDVNLQPMPGPAKSGARQGGEGVQTLRANQDEASSQAVATQAAGAGGPHSQDL